ncbi:MAG: hypothetical protein A3H97_23690, partial [Acidobacteria bacterium RIFCSPLOWO2_02_FULL_65_29]
MSVCGHTPRASASARGARGAAVVLAVACTFGGTVRAQSITYRGFVEGRGVLFPQDTLGDSRNLVTDGLVRGEVFARSVPWLGLAVGVDLRANNHDHVEESWHVDLADRGTLRPRVSIRRLTATISRGPLSIDIGKQFIRWGKADIVNPTDRFAPRDFLNVIDSELLAVRGARAVLELGSNTLDAVWVPVFTPSRLPLLNQRWTAVESGVDLEAQNEDNAFPRRSQAGVRWGRLGGGHEYSVSFYEGVNHLPNLVPQLPPSDAPPGAPFVIIFLDHIDVVRRYPSLRMFGGDGAVPTRWFTAKGEVAYFTSSTPTSDEYVLYVAQLERQTGEWLLVGGYAGEVVTARRSSLMFAPDRGTARTILGRASYTIDVNRTAAVEAAVRQNGDGLYVKGEYSQARGQHWRATLTGALIRGEPDDFLGQ